MVINHNMSAMFAQRSQGIQDLNQQKSMEKLSSGMRINRAGDDASGLAVSEKMRAQIRGLNQASENAENGISFIQTTEGYLQETTDIIQRIRELAVQSSNGIYAAEDRMQIQVEVSSLIAEVDRIASCAQFNGMNMLTGRFARPTGENVVTGSMWFHIGANMDQRTQVYIGTMSAMALGLRNVGDESIMTLETPDEANRAIGTLDEALKKINKQRADLGAYQNRLEETVKGLDIGIILLTTVLTILLNDAERRIPVSYAQRVAGRRRVGGQSTHIPLKVNTGNVMPIIFASTLMSVPSIIINLFSIKVKSTVGTRILEGLNQNYWFKPGYPWAYIGLAFYILLVIFFAYFYTSISFNPMEIAQNLKKSGGFVPGIRPGKPTQEYLNNILNYIVIIGAVGLMIVALIPIFFNGRFGADVSFGGTSLIIIVGVIIETIKQIESKMVVRNYSGFLNN